MMGLDKDIKTESTEAAPLLKIEHLNISFTRYEQGLYRKTMSVIRDMDLNVFAGEMVAVVGSSGSGKTCGSGIASLQCQGGRQDHILRQ